jgi:hypothetical protein
MQEPIIQINDEIVINQCLQMFKNMFTNVFIFILCIFLFMNPIILVNILLFISIFLFIKTTLVYVMDKEIESSTEIKINFDECELLRDRIKKLKKVNTILKDKIDRSDRKHKKREKLPFFETRRPFKINVEFNENTENDIEVKKNTDEVVNEEVDKVVDDEVGEVMDEVVDDEVGEVMDEVVDDEVGEVMDEVVNEEVADDEVVDEKPQQIIDFDKIISDVINEMIKCDDALKYKDDDFAILSNTPTNYSDEE